MSAQSLLLALLTLVIGGAITYLIARRAFHRPKLEFHLDQALTIVPDELNLEPALQMTVGGRIVRNICALSLEVANRGARDIVVTDATPPRPANATPLPRLDFSDFGILAVKTLNNDASRFYVPLGNAGQRLYINLHRLRAKSTARFQVLGELKGGRTSFVADQARLFPGGIMDVDVITSGLISRPWLTA